MDNTYGALAVTVIEALEVDLVLGQIIGSNLPFDVWYRKWLQELYGVNLAGYEQFAQTQPLPVNQEVYFEWALNFNDGKILGG